MICVYVLVNMHESRFPNFLAKISFAWGERGGTGADTQGNSGDAGAGEGAYGGGGERPDVPTPLHPSHPRWWSSSNLHFGAFDHNYIKQKRC